MRRWLTVASGVAVLALVAAACSSSDGSGDYTPQTRHFQMVTIQELIGEFANIPDLKDEIDTALKPGGPTDGHEVYAWDPNALTVYQGDTVDLAISNAQGDEHIFVLPEFNVNTPIPPDSSVDVSFKASKVGVFQYICGVPEHQPWMQGFLTVLPDSDATA